MNASSIDHHAITDTKEHLLVLSRYAFTLIELVVVLALTALLAGSALMMVNQPLSQAAREQALSEFRFLDALGRDRGQQATGVMLGIDPQTQTTTLYSRNEGVVLGTCNFPRSWRLVSVLGAERSGSGTFGVAYDTFGTSPSYALQFRDKNNDDHYWLVVGLTGQIHVNLPRNEVAEVLHADRNNLD